MSTAAPAPGEMVVTLVPITFPAFEAVCLAMRDEDGAPLDVDDVLLGRQPVPEDQAAPLRLVVAAAHGADGAPVPPDVLAPLALALTHGFFAAARAQVYEAATLAQFYADRSGASALATGGGEVSLRRLIHRDGSAGALALLDRPIRDLLTHLFMLGIDHAATHAADYLS